MADSPEVIQARIDVLKKALSSGALIVKHGDTQVTYRSVAELEEAIAILTSQLNTANGTPRGPKYAQQTTKAH